MNTNQVIGWQRDQWKKKEIVLNLISRDCSTLIGIKINDREAVCIDGIKQKWINNGETIFTIDTI